MHFELFAIDKFELELMWENMPVAGVCHITDSDTGRCTRNIK